MIDFEGTDLGVEPGTVKELHSPLEYQLSKTKKRELCERIIGEANRLLDLARAHGIHDFKFTCPDLKKGGLYEEDR